MNAELKDQIKSRIFLEQDVKISGDDPLFGYFIGTQALLDNFSQPIIEAVERIPGVLEQSLEKIVVAVEDVERTSEAICIETKSTLAALAKCELESAHQHIKESIGSSVTGALGTALQRVSADVAEMECKAKSMASGFRDPKAMLINLVLAATVAVLICVFSAGLFLMYRVGIKNVEAANYWRIQYQEQQRTLNTLAPSLRKQLPTSLQTD